jgi:hypothetical protein
MRESEPTAGPHRLRLNDNGDMGMIGEMIPNQVASEARDNKYTINALAKKLTNQNVQKGRSGDWQKRLRYVACEVSQSRA